MTRRALAANGAWAFARRARARDAPDGDSLPHMSVMPDSSGVEELLGAVRPPRAGDDTLVHQILREMQSR